MNRKIIFVLLITVLFAFPVFAVEETDIPDTIRNNRFYLESLRLTKLAQETYDVGEYEASAGFAEEAILFALRSDEFVAEQLIIEAKRLLDWANGTDIPNQFPNNFNQAKEYYDVSVEAHSNEEWTDSIEASVNSIEILAAFETGRTVTRTASTTGTGTGTTTSSTDASGLPRQYTVRTWIVERDCLWNIAGYPWVYGDPWKWPTLYEANKSRMPDPNNPDLIEPGMVLDIPSLGGESRQGAWTQSSSDSSSNRSVPANR